MTRYYVFYNFGIMPNPQPPGNGFDTEEEAQAFINARTTPDYYRIIKVVV